MKKKWEELRDLVLEALSRHQAGDTDSALAILDEAISFAKEAGYSPVDLMIRRELLKPNEQQDFSLILDTMQREIRAYGHRGEILNQIEMLMNLADMRSYRLRQHSEALLDIINAEELISSVTKKNMSVMAEEHASLDAEFFENLFSLRKQQLNKL